MAIIGALDKTKHFAEFSDPYFGPSGNMTPAERKAEALENLGLTATAAEINAVVAKEAIVSVTDAASYTVLAADSGKLHLLPDFTATCTLDLPTAAEGLLYEFVSAARVADAQNAVFDTGSDTNFFLGAAVWLRTGAGDTDDEVVLVSPNGSSNSILTLVTPAPGTHIKVYCDGTNWILLDSRVVSATTPAFTDQA